MYFLSHIDRNYLPFVARLLCVTQSACYMEELEFLAKAATSGPNGDREPGIIALQHAFYDKENAYIITDYYPGGMRLRGGLGTTV